MDFKMVPVELVAANASVADISTSQRPAEPGLDFTNIEIARNLAEDGAQKLGVLPKLPNCEPAILRAARKFDAGQNARFCPAVPACRLRSSYRYRCLDIGRREPKAKTPVENRFNKRSKRH